MKRIHKIQNHPVYREQYQLLEEAEKDRIFCRHTMEHFLDVARLMYIYDLEDEAGIDKELIYAAALLHDIGRYEQIRIGTPHHIAGAKLAGKILGDCEFQQEEICKVQEAIAEHRTDHNDADRHTLAAYLYKADKRSRNCFSCSAYAECNWPEEKKNRMIDK